MGWLLLLACTGSTDSGAPSADSATAPTPTDSATSFCDGVPQLTWETFGEGFLLSQCNGCHAATTPNRHDAPEEVTFDTPTQAWAWAERILARATGEDATMPPNGGVSADDRTRLEWWLRCGVPGT